MENNQPLTDEQRRERRRRRILENSGSRMTTILSGPDGTEIRNAPIMEGGEVFSAPTSTESTPPMSPRLPSKPTSSFASVVDSKRRFLSFLFGLLCRLTMLYTGAHANITIPWFFIYTTIEFMILRKFRTTSMFPEEFRSFFEMLPREALPFDMSFVASGITMFREFTQDSMFMVAGFILTQYSLIISDYYITQA